MFNTLTEPLIRMTTPKGSPKSSLTEVYAALMADQVESFPALRPHQRHAWHAFLVQLGAMALHRAGLAAPLTAAAEWEALIREMTVAWPADEPWQLVVEDMTQPAFMQPPAGSGDKLAEYKGVVATPDALDILVTSKNHDLKAAVMWEAGAEDWIFALITLQTMEGYSGRGNYGISRMNGGLGSRPAFSLAPLGGPGAHVQRDIKALLSDYPAAAGPHDLLWLWPWDGTAAERLQPRELAPLYIEVCRRVRLRTNQAGRLSCVRTGSKAPRIEGKKAKGRTGDPWTPHDPDRDGLPLTLAAGGFTYRRVKAYLLEWTPSALLNATPEEQSSDATMQLVARGMVRGQGKTAGYHERIIPLRSKTRQALQHPSGPEGLGGIAHQRLEQIGIVQGILSQAIQVYTARGGRDSDSDSTRNEQARRAVARPWLRQLDESVDGHFFDDLQTEWEAEAKDERTRIRHEWLREVVLAPARRLLQSAGESLPYPTIYRYRARAQAEGLFEGRLRGTGGLPFLFDTQEENSHMSTSLSPAPAAARGTEGQSRIWGDIAYRFTCAVAEMAARDRGGLAGLRRMKWPAPAPPAFWRLMPAQELLHNPGLELQWGLILHGIALMTDGAGGSGGSAHDGAVSVGRALYAGGALHRSRPLYSEDRMARLLTARGDTFRALLPRMFRIMSAAHVSFNWREMARLILSEECDAAGAEQGRRRLARDYYREEWRNSQQSTRNQQGE